MKRRNEDEETLGYKGFDEDEYFEDEDIEIENLDDEPDYTQHYDSENYEKTFWEKARDKDSFISRLWKKKPFKIVLLVLEILVILVLIFGVWLVFAENSKMKFIKSFSGCSLGQTLIGCIIGSDYEKYMMDSEFEDDDIEYNVELDGDYTNIAIFGVDSRNNDDASLNNNSDTIMILSINNETKEVKIASVYRDTLVEFTADGYTDYAKATDVYSYGGPKASINMLNKNFDLNISDYITINWSGLANIIDAFGGIDITITEDERVALNDYITDLLYWTDMKTDYLDSSGDVHLNGAQATAYCRIRSETFYAEDGTAIADDYGRTARQRLVIQKLLDNAKESSIKELLSVSELLLKENTEDNTFMKTSLKLSEILNLVPLVLEIQFDGGKGFPENHISYTTPSGGASLAPDTLFSTVQDMHEYLFGEKSYKPSSIVKTLSQKIIDLTKIVYTTTPETTQETTTQEPTTQEPTTQEPTTQEPTTQEPTTKPSDDSDDEDPVVPVETIDPE